jgi:hypothetical protein
MRLTRTVHLATSMTWAPMSQLAPDVQLQVETPRGGDPSLKPPEVHGLCFADPDGVAHIYVLDDQGREALMKQLTGGLVLL